MTGPLWLTLMISLLTGIDGSDGSDGSDGPERTRVMRGREIYLTGKSAGPEIRLLLANAGLELPATSFPCSACHGEDGRGTREGGLIPPPIRWQDLTRPATVELSGRRRSAFDPESLRRAILEGIDPDGIELHPGMPRYKMSSAQSQDLEAYLRVLGSEQGFDPGVKEDRLRLGTVLPLTGKQRDSGESVRQALLAWSQQIGAVGIYGRSIEWVFEDSESTPEGTLKAFERISAKDVFALVSGFLPQPVEGIEEILTRSQLPLIGPITITPSPQDPPFPWAYYLFPSYYQQARSLVEFIGTETVDRVPQVALVVEADSVFDGARRGVLEQLAIFGTRPVLDLVPAEGHFDPILLAQALEDCPADTVVVLASGAQTLRLSMRLDVLDSTKKIFTIGSVLGRDAFSLPESMGERTYITFPSVLESDRRKSDLDWLLYLAKDTGFKIQNAAVQSAALCAVKLVQETAEKCGRRLSRDLFIQKLEKTQEFRTGLVPPLSFSPSRHVGSLGSHILRVN
ncbi:MAG: ABC transporter substrate-binding protein, partial [Planctomycetota bacterium]|nr:ABC transporter substrate-binding protein [Planctomycetota bacterium]